MDINQNEMPTKSSAAKLAAAVAVLGITSKNNNEAIIFVVRLVWLKEKHFFLVGALFINISVLVFKSFHMLNAFVVMTA